MKALQQIQNLRWRMIALRRALEDMEHTVDRLVQEYAKEQPNGTATVEQSGDEAVQVGKHA